MAQLTSIKMSKFDNQPWGFRLQGGIDFASPLTVQKVHGGSLAEKAGLRVGDALIRVNNTDIYQLRHKDAQDAVSRAGNNFELVVSRGGGMQKTAAKPSDAHDLIQHPAPQAPAPIQQKSIPKTLNLTAKPFVRSTQTTPVTSVKMSLSPELTNNNYLTSPPPPPLSDNKIVTPDETARAKELLTQKLAVMRVQPASPPVRNGPSLVSTPASSPLSSSLTTNKTDAVRTGFHDPRSSGPPSFVAIQKTDGGNVKLVNRQFNSPMGLYSEENIAETLSSQAEVLAQGVLGVNFKKNEKHYDPANSEVFKMVQEIDRAPREPEPGIDIDPVDASPAQKGLASRTIQSRAFQRIHQQTVRSLEASSSPILSPNSSSTEDRHLQMGHISTPNHKPFMVNSPAASLPTHNVGGGFHSPSSNIHPAPPPPVGGVRIFPAGVHQQVKIEESFEETRKVVESTTVVASSTSETITTTEETVCPATMEPAPLYSSAPATVKPVSFAPAARPAPPATSGEFNANRVVWPPVANTESEEMPSDSSVAVAPQQQQQPLVIDEQVAAAPVQVVESPVLRPPTPVVACPIPPAAAVVAVEAHDPADSQEPAVVDSIQHHQMNQQQPSNPGMTGFGSTLAAAAAAASSAQSPKGSASGVQSAPRRGKGVLNPQVAVGARVPVCSSCNMQIRGKFVTALGLTWCPDHFVCGMQQCRRPLHDIGFVEEKKQLYCEGCFENYLAPTCARCSKRVKGDCLNAIGKQFHPECFACTYCGRLFGNSHFYLEDGLPYCEADWNELFTTKCYSCGFPIEAGDRWVEAMNNNYHSQCFNCSVCKKNLEGQSFLGKNGRPMCKSHAR